MTTYAEKLKDPRWQKKRLEILQRDNFTCQYCTESEKTLHVHHIVYRKGRQPWEGEDYDYITLCKDCHKIEHCKNLPPLEEIMIYFTLMEEQYPGLNKKINKILLTDFKRYFK